MTVFKSKASYTITLTYVTIEVLLLRYKNVNTNFIQDYKLRFNGSYVSHNYSP